MQNGTIAKWYRKCRMERIAFKNNIKTKELVKKISITKLTKC